MNQQRVRRIVLWVTVCIAITISAAAIGTVGIRGARRQSAVGAPDKADYTYLLQAYDGYVAVFTPTSNSPAYLTEIPLTALPQPDQDALFQGIPIYSEEALTAYLEDYGS